MPLDWGRAVTRWARMHTASAGIRREAAPDRNDEWLFYQTLVGIWPPEGASAADDELVERIAAYLLKAAREAKLHTSWVNPNERYEAALRHFVEGALRGRSSARFLESLRETAADVARRGALNSLSALVLKLVSPGVADTYQGCELWDLSLVDPDNRRPVDFTRRARAPRGARSGVERAEVPASFLAELLASWPDGRLKLFVLARGLRLRRERPRSSSKASRSASTDRRARRAIVAAARRRGAAFALAIVPRLTRALASGDRPFPLGDVWGEPASPCRASSARSRRVHGRPVRATDGFVAIAEVLRRWPVTLLVSSDVLTQRAAERTGAQPVRSLTYLDTTGCFSDRDSAQTGEHLMKLGSELDLDDIDRRHPRAPARELPTPLARIGDRSACRPPPWSSASRSSRTAASSQGTRRCSSEPSASTSPPSSA